MVKYIKMNLLASANKFANKTADKLADARFWAKKIWEEWFVYDAKQN